MHVSSKTKQQSDKPQQKQTQQSPRIEEVRIVKIVLRNRPPRDKYGREGKNVSSSGGGGGKIGFIVYSWLVSYKPVVILKGKW